MPSMWLVVALISLGPLFVLSSPDKLQQYGPGAFLAIVQGLVAEYALSAARPIWKQAHHLLPLGGVELSYVILFYGSQACLLFQFFPHASRFQTMYVLVFAGGTALLEAALSPLLFGPISTLQVVSGVVFHGLRLFALVALFSALGYFDRVVQLKQERKAREKVHGSVRMWQYIWPSTGVLAYVMLRATQRFARRQ